VEGGEGHAPLDESLQVAVAGAEATQEVQHQGTIGNWLAEIAERVSQALHLAAVFSHGEVPLREQVELGVEVERPRIPIPEELVLESEPRLACSVRLIADDVLQLNGDGTVEPREDNAVHEAPGARRWSVVVDEDVIVEDEPPQREKDLSSPAGVVGRRRIQHHGHEGPDVVQTSGLSVESSDEVGVEVRVEGVLRGFHRGDRRATEEALRGGHLGGQSGTQGTLSLQGEGGGALALPRGCHSGLDRSESVNERGGGRSKGGKARRRSAAQCQRGDSGKWRKAGDVGGGPPWAGLLLIAAGAIVPVAAVVVSSMAATVGGSRSRGRSRVGEGAPACRDLAPGRRVGAAACSGGGKQGRVARRGGGLAAGGGRGGVRERREGEEPAAGGRRRLQGVEKPPAAVAAVGKDLNLNLI
jgi:hypothetical protein